MNRVSTHMRLKLWLPLVTAILFAGLPVADYAHESAESPRIAHLRADTVPRQARLPGRGFGESLDSSRLYSRFLLAMVGRPALAAPGGDPASGGQWSDIISWPLVPVHATLLPNGKILAYESVGNQATESYSSHTYTRAVLWDPNSGEFQERNVDTGFNIFCSGLMILPDGRAFIAGGNLNSNLDGLDTTHTFDPANSSWTLGPRMSQGGRWYPSTTPLANGEVLITSGGPSVPEIRGVDGSLRPLYGGRLNMPLYPWMLTAPNGRVTYFGPNPTIYSLDPSGNGSWDPAGQRDGIRRDYGSYAAYDINKVLVAGGGSSTSSAMVVDTDSLQAAATDSMNYGRRQHNLTLLADGTVLATGGNSSGVQLIDMGNGVYPAELWNPATGKWTVLNRMQRTRQYHSIAMLLPDGRVLSGGGGVCAVCTNAGYIYEDAEIFSPPYLFKKDGSGQLADRPQITAVAEMLNYGRAFDLASPDASRISKVALVGLSAVTHSTNFQQRYIPMSFTPGSGSIRFRTPGDANIAPPGYYLLFVIKNDGVPSTGRFVHLDGAELPENNPPTVTSPGNQASMVGSSVSLPVTAADPDSDRLIFNATGLPPGLSIDAGSGRISGTPTTAGSYPVGLTVADTRGAIGTTNFVWLVSQDAPPPAFSSGVLYEYYEGNWTSIPKFDGMTPKKTGVVRNFNIGPRERDRNLAMRFRTKLLVPTDGTYTFYLKSADLGKLWIDGAVVTRNRSPGIVRERSGSVTLAAGTHDIVAAYLAADGPPAFQVFVEGPDVAKQRIPRDWLQQPANGVAYEYFEGSWTRFPDFSQMTPKQIGFTSVVDLSPRLRNRDFALRFRGKLRLAKAGPYTFYLKSYRGSKVWIDGNPVVGNSGADPDRERNVTLALARGDHDIQVDYFQTSGPGTLNLNYRGPGLPRQPICSNALPNN